MKNVKKDISRQIFYIVIIFSFLTIFVYNLLTPYMSDDLLVDKSIYKSFADIIRQEYWQYHNWNGRSVLQIILKIFMLVPKPVFDFFNSLCYVATMLLIYWNVNNKKKYDVFLYILINLCTWCFAVEFDQTILWIAGACNYLWGVFIILGFISIYRYYLQKGNEIKNKPLACVLLFLMGMLAGWGNENTSGGAILIIGLYSLYFYLKNHTFNKVMISGLLGSCIGFLFLLLAPGNAVRGAMVKAEESYSGLAAYISRGLKILKAIDEYFLIYIAVICLLGVYFYYKKTYHMEQFIDTAIFAFAALATAGVLIFTPQPMDRAYFGANIYMMMAALQMVQLIRKEDIFLISLKTGGILAAFIAMIFVYVEQGANLARIRREVATREEYILEQVSNGETSLVLPQLRTEFASKYSMAHLSDISDDETNWNNELYKNAYSFHEITVLSWDEWEEYVGK